MIRKRSYLVELEYSKGNEVYISHNVCVSNRRNIELSGLIASIGDDVKEWRILSVTPIDNKDAVLLDEILSKKEAGGE